MDICFVISHLPDSRYKKRFELLKNQWDLCVLYWNKRGKNVRPIVDIDIPAISIDIEADQTSPLKRIPQLMQFSQRALEMLKNEKPRCVYVGNLDMLSIACKYKKLDPAVKIVYEIADLHRYIADKPNNPIRKLIRSSLISEEKKLIPSVDLLVLTSWKFYEQYYCNLIAESKVVLLPNMPNPADFRNYHKKQDGPFTVGFIGSIRYKDQLKMLIRAGKRAGVHVLFAGAATDDEIESLCRENSDCCTFLGAFNYTQEIANLYGKLDCVYSVYDADMANVRLALPNKLYEAILCELPIIVAENTYLAELTQKWGTGFAVGHMDEDGLYQLLCSLKNKSQLYLTACYNCERNVEQVNPKRYADKLVFAFSNIL